jgi:hypothetical protein
MQGCAQPRQGLPFDNPVQAKRSAGYENSKLNRMQYISPTWGFPAKRVFIFPPHGVFLPEEFLRFPHVGFSCQTSFYVSPAWGFPAGRVFTFPPCGVFLPEEFLRFPHVGFSCQTNFYVSPMWGFLAGRVFTFPPHGVFLPKNYFLYYI